LITLLPSFALSKSYCLTAVVHRGHQHVPPICKGPMRDVSWMLFHPCAFRVLIILLAVKFLQSRLCMSLTSISSLYHYSLRDTCAKEMDDTILFPSILLQCKPPISPRINPYKPKGGDDKINTQEKNKQSLYVLGESIAAKDERN